MEQSNDPDQQKAKKKGSIEFQGVSFAYAGREEILSDVNLKVEPGETIGILGMQSAGKSTCLSR